MKVSKSWLQEMVDLKVSMEEVERLLPLRTIATKEITPDFIELDMKGYNRADLLSMRGVALEVAAITDSKIKFVEEVDKDFIWIDKSLPKTGVEIVDDDLCPIYCVAKIEGLVSAPSKPEWVKRLNDSGMRTVNNIADVTNLIMLEYGQPMHSFDAAQIEGENIVVRRANKGEEIVTLDGKKRVLEEGDLLIADSKKALGIAGVMGGKDSEASENTTTILLEAAIFEPRTLRRTVSRLGLPSEASKRFIHGLTKKRLFQALDRAIRMYQEMGGKLTALNIVGESEDQLKKVPLTLEKTNSLIGLELTGENVEDYLKKLGFEMSLVSEGKWVVTPPFYRLDIALEEDLIEEIARLYGYERIPSKELVGELPERMDQKLFEVLYQSKKTLVDLGLTEVQTYSFYSTQILQAMGFNESNKDAVIKVANPISSETEYLREFIWPNLIEVIAKNMKYGYEDIAIFEIGKVYNPQKEGKPKESYRLAVALMNGGKNPIEELLAILKRFNEKMNLGISFKAGGMMKELESLFHPNRFALAQKGENPLGGVAEVHPRFLNRFGLQKRIAIVEIAIEPLL